MDSQSEENVPIPVLELKENQENQIRLKVKNLSLVLSIKMDENSNEIVANMNPSMTGDFEENKQENLDEREEASFSLGSYQNYEEPKKNMDLGYLERSIDESRIIIRPHDDFYIGRRKSACKIIISSKDVSRIHSRIEATKKHVKIRLYSETSSMAINGESIFSNPLTIYEPYILKDGDKVRIGPETFTFHCLKAKQYSMNSSDIVDSSSAEIQSNSSSTSPVGTNMGDMKAELEKIDKQPPLDLISKFESTEQKSKNTNSKKFTYPRISRGGGKNPNKSNFAKKLDFGQKPFLGRESSTFAVKVKSPSKDDFGNKFVVDKKTVERFKNLKEKKKTVCVSPILTKDPPPKPEKRQPFVAGLKFRGNSLSSRSYDHTLSRLEKSQRVNRSRDISDEENNVLLDTSNSDLFTQMLLDGSDHSSFNGNSTLNSVEHPKIPIKKNVLRGFKKAQVGEKKYEHDEADNTSDHSSYNGNSTMKTGEHPKISKKKNANRGFKKAPLRQKNNEHEADTINLHEEASSADMIIEDIRRV